MGIGSAIVSVGGKEKPTAPAPAIAPGVRWEVHSGERSEKAGGVFFFFF